jgi:hypothetical protein
VENAFGKICLLERGVWAGILLLRNKYKSNTNTEVVVDVLGKVEMVAIVSGLPI